MDTINERIAYLIKDLGCTKSDFAEKLCVTPSFISAVCSGKKQPSERTILDICRIFNVSAAWLQDGVGEMYVRRSANEELAILVNDLMSDADESFRKRFVSLLLALPPESWAAIEDFAKKLQKSTED